ELFRQAQEWRIPAAPVEDVRERLECPQLAARGFFVPVDVDGTQVRVPRVACRISTIEPVERGPVRSLAAPLPRSAAADGAPAGGDSPAEPFRGLRVLDF